MRISGRWNGVEPRGLLGSMKESLHVGIQTGHGGLSDFLPPEQTFD